MRVFVTGATGFIGSAVVQELIAEGHKVVGLARSDASAAALLAAGAEVQRGSLEDLESLKAAASSSDGVIHLAFIHDFSDYAGAGKTDLRAVQAIGEALAGSGRPFVITSGSALLPSGQVATEDDAADSKSVGAPRVASEEAALALAAKGVRSSIVRLPPTVHGDGDRAFVPALINIARTKGVSAYVREGTNQWAAVHRQDAARLYRLALEKGVAGSRYHGVHECLVFRDLATVIGQKLGVPVKSIPAEEASVHFSWLGHFAQLDNPVSSKLTRERLGWEPRGPSLFEDLEKGHYFSSVVASIADG